MLVIHNLRRSQREEVQQIQRGKPGSTSHGLLDEFTSRR